MHGTAMHGETKEKRRKLGNGWKRQMPCFGHLLKWTLPFPKYLITFIDDGLLVTSRTIKHFFYLGAHCRVCWCCFWTPCLCSLECANMPSSTFIYLLWCNAKQLHDKYRTSEYLSVISPTGCDWFPACKECAVIMFHFFCIHCLTLHRSHIMPPISLHHRFWNEWNPLSKRWKRIPFALGGGADCQVLSGIMNGWQNVVARLYIEILRAYIDRWSIIMIRHSLKAKLVYWYTACKNRVQADVLASKSMVKHPFELLVVLACNEWIALQLMAMASANICAIYKFTKVKSEMLSLCCCCFFYWAAHAQIIHGRWWKVNASLLLVKKN